MLRLALLIKWHPVAAVNQKDNTPICLAHTSIFLVLVRVLISLYVCAALLSWLLSR